MTKVKSSVSARDDKPGDEEARALAKGLKGLARFEEDVGQRLCRRLNRRAHRLRRSVVRRNVRFIHKFLSVHQVIVVRAHDIVGIILIESRLTTLWA